MSLLRRARTTVWAAGFLSLALSMPAPIPGQVHDSLTTGARVRVKLPDHGAAWLQGQLVMLSADSAAIALTETPDTVRFATEVPGRFEVSQGLHARTGKGALIGLGIGGGAGLILGLAASAENCTGFCPAEVGPAEILGVAALLGGVGAGIGALIGSRSRSERWGRVDLQHRRVGLEPLTRGGRFRIALQLQLSRGSLGRSDSRLVVP